MEATVLPRTRELLAKSAEDPLVPLFRVIFSDVFTDIDDRDQVIAGYERWLGDVREQIEPHQLVEWQPVDDWEPLCNALDVPVPERPFPHENSTASYLARREERARKEDARQRTAEIRSLPGSPPPSA